MKAVLKPFQQRKADFLASRWHACCAAEPGLGKTLIMLRAAEMVGAKSGLVTCPASVRTYWYQTIEEQFGRIGDWGVISYNEAVRKCNGYNKHPHKANHNYRLQNSYDVWLGDEIHFCKTLGSRRTHAIFGADGVVKRAKFKWALSGTLAPNGRPVELYPMLKALAPGFNMRFATYAQRYCGAFFDGRGMRNVGASHLDELNEKLKDFVTHVSWKEAYPDRHEPLIERIPVDLTMEDMKAVYEEEEAIGAREATLSSRYDRYSQMGDTSRLLRLLGVAKLRRAIQYITDVLTACNKVVVFCRHTEVLDQLFYYFSERSYHPVLFQGGMTDAQKDFVKRKFIYEPSCRIIFGQEEAAGTGIDGLQKVCSRAIDVEPSWTPGVTEQKLRRLDRMGQTDNLVTYSMLYANGTLDEVKAVVHQRKERVGARLFSGQDTHEDWVL